LSKEKYLDLVVLLFEIHGEIVDHPQPIETAEAILRALRKPYSKDPSSEPPHAPPPGPMPKPRIFLSSN